MKAVLISIQPKWCELIASGEKTIEVRKSKPRPETPFKAYIYETKTPLRWNKAHNAIVGEWIKEQYKHKNGRYFYYAPICSICRDSNVDEPNFCPNCGAYMKGGAE